MPQTQTEKISISRIVEKIMQGSLSVLDEVMRLEEGEYCEDKKFYTVIKLELPKKASWLIMDLARGIADEIDDAYDMAFGEDFAYIHYGNAAVVYLDPLIYVIRYV